MSTINPLPFQYLQRGDDIANEDGTVLATTIEMRDRELEDFLGVLYDRITKLEARVTALGG